MGAAPGQSPLFRARARNVCSSNDSSDIPSFLPIPIPNSLFLSFFQPLLRWWRRRHRRNERTTMQRPQRGPNMTEGIRNGMGGGGGAGRNAPFSVPTSLPSIFLSSIWGFSPSFPTARQRDSGRRRLPILSDKETCIHILPLYQCFSLSPSISFSPHTPISTAYVPRPLSPCGGK